MINKSNILSFLFLSFLVFFGISDYRETHSAQADNTSEMMEISRELKCIECDGQNVYESNSNFSKSIKAYILTQLSQGNDRSTIIENIRIRYGDAVLMKPPFQGNTFILWVTPFLILILGIGFVSYKIIKNKKS
ncbi:MAG: cytochrome c-type biogenesis protein [Hyphomicrobiales bacterium]